MNRITAQTGNEIRSIHGVRDVGANVGRAITGDDVANANQSQLWISLDPKADYDTTVAAVRRTVKGYPGIESDVKTYSEAQFTDVETGADEPVVVRVYDDRVMVKSFWVHTCVLASGLAARSRRSTTRLWCL